MMVCVLLTFGLNAVLKHFTKSDMVGGYATSSSFILLHADM